MQIRECCNTDDSATTHMHHDACVVLALGKAQHLDAHQRRHYDFVADHCGERDTRNDDHARRSREAADKCENGQPGLSALHGQGQHEGVTAEFTGRQHCQPGQRYRDDECREDQQVQRECQTHRSDIGVFVSLDDSNVKLPRQAENRRAGQDQLCDERVGPMVESEHCLRTLGCQLRYSIEITKRQPSENTDCNKRE